MTAAVLFAAALSVSSPAFQQNGSIPPAFTCDGAGKNPELQIGGVPAAAKSLALIVFDPDVPKAIKSDGRYLHWALWNLAPTSAVIEESRGGGLSECVGQRQPGGQSLFNMDVGDQSGAGDLGDADGGGTLGSQPGIKSARACAFGPCPRGCGRQ